MTKPKSPPPPVPEFEWGDNRLSIGAIVLDMAQTLLIDALRQPNQLEVMSRRAEFVRQVNAAFVERACQQERRINSGEASKRHSQAEAASLMPHIEKCSEYLRAKGRKVNATQILSVWDRCVPESVDCPDPKTLRKLILGKP